MQLLFPRFVAILFLGVLAWSGVRAEDDESAPGKPDATWQGKASEDGVIGNFHSLGKINGQGPIFRCASPVAKVVAGMKTDEPTPEQLQEATRQMQHLRELGIRTVVSLQMQEAPTEKKANKEYRAVSLEEAAAKAAGIKYVGFSMANRGKGSLQDMDSAAVAKVVEAVTSEILSEARNGGVVFHCQSGKDRTGLVAGYLRMKYQSWTLEDALAEMRGYGHVWQKFSRPGATHSWHEQHLQEITKDLAAASTRP